MNTPGRVILDTSIVIAHFRNDQAIEEKLQATSFMLPVIALGELYTGAQRKAVAREVALKAVSDFASLAELLRPDEDTAWHYGRLRSELMSKGSPIPDNDIWIAAMAMQYDLPLANRDGHFDRIAGLTQEKW